MTRAATWCGLTLALAGPGLLAFGSERFATPAQPFGLRVPWLLGFAGLVGLVLLIARRAERLSWRQLGLGRLSWRSPLRGALLAAFLIFLYGPAVVTLLERLGGPGWEAGVNVLAGLPRWYVFATIVIVASGEEWLYRGYAIGRLEALTRRTWVAGLLSLLAFGVAHLPLWGMTVALSTLVAGALFTGLYLWHRDVWYLIIAHVAADLAGLS